MLIDRLLRVPITITSVSATGAPDEFGDPTEETSTISTLGYAWQVSRTDDTANTDLQTEEWRVALPADLAGTVDGGDRLSVEGIDFEIFGPPWPARNPRTNRVEHLEATLRRSTT